MRLEIFLSRLAESFFATQLGFATGGPAGTASPAPNLGGKDTMTLTLKLALIEAQILLREAHENGGDLVAAVARLRSAEMALGLIPRVVIA